MLQEIMAGQKAAFSASAHTELRGQLNLPVARLNAHLTMLELRGIVVRMPGGMYRAYLPKD